MRVLRYPIFFPAPLSVRDHRADEGFIPPCGAPLSAYLQEATQSHQGPPLTRGIRAW